MNEYEYKLYEDINIDIKIVGGRKFPISELVEKYEPEKRLAFSK